MSYNLVSGMSQHFYHTVPSELDRITVSPTREGISKYLSQIEHSKFPEFILDILIDVLGHKHVDITDGQGDEKQDIITTNPKGERCLVQCKHTGNYTSNYNGNDLDIMMMACMRKNCKQAIFVTNSDLTPQGKRYITDDEYNRSYASTGVRFDIDYWNGYKIWDLIKNNQTILNKWFGNLGQVSGLRTFRFDMTFQKMPYVPNEAESEVSAFQRLIDRLKSLPWIKETVGGNSYFAKISDEYDILIKEYFQFTGGLDINFMPPGDGLDFINNAKYSFDITVSVKSTGSYSSNLIRAEIVKKFGDDILSGTDSELGWWHILTSQIKSIIYLHDIKEPREIDMASARTFVKVGGQPTSDELEYCTAIKTKFKVKENNDDEYFLVHKASGIKLFPFFEQRINPVMQFNHQIIEYNNLKQLAEYDFYFVEDVSPSMLMTLRKMLHPEWKAFTRDDTSLIWAVDPYIDNNKKSAVHMKVESMGLRILEVKKEDIKTLLANVQKDLVPGSWMYTSELKSLSYPINLDKRILMFNKCFKCKSLSDIQKIRLLEYKYQYENSYGFDNLHGEESKKINALGLKEELFDFFTIRGNRMLEIGYDGSEISVYLRFNENKLDSIDKLCKLYLKDFNDAFATIKNIVGS